MNRQFKPSTGEGGCLPKLPQKENRALRPGPGAIWVFLCPLPIFWFLTVAAFPAPAEVVYGRPGVATYRAVANLKALADLDESASLTNRGPVAIPPPMPRWTNSPGQAPGFMSSPFDLFSAPEGGGSGGLLSPGLISPAPAESFLALEDDNTSIPPDTFGAVGPDHLMVTLNTQVRVQDRTGATISTLSLNAFWQQVGVQYAFDPRVLYDPYAGRWMFSSVADGPINTSSILLAVSQTSDPTGNWNLFRVDADPDNLVWADYPGIGFNRDWIVVTANMFPIDEFFGGTYGVNVYVFNKTNLYSRGAGTYTLLQENSGRGFTLVPAVTYDTNITTLYLVEVDNLLQNYYGSSSQLRLSTITGNVGAERLTLGTGYVSAGNSWGSSDPTFFYGFLPQLDSFIGIDAGDTRIQNVVYRNGSLWATHTVFLPGGSFPTHTAAQWWQFTPDAGLLQFGRIEDTTGRISYAYPSIGVNRCDDVLIGYSSFSADQYASGNYSFRYATDPTNTMRADYVLKPGEGPYTKDFFSFRVRWGDYSATVVDPLNDLDFWTIQEYAATPDLTDPFFPSRWGTWWGKVDLASTKPNRIDFSSTTFVVNEAPPPGFATITVLNMGGLAGSVDYTTSDGTAQAGIDYLPASGTLTFTAGQVSADFYIQILDNADSSGDKTVNLTLSNPQGGGELGCGSEAVLVILDDEKPVLISEAGEFNFSTYTGNQPFYVVTENENAIVTVVRTNGSTGRILVDYATTEGGTAVPGFDYFPVSGTLVFDDYQMSASFSVPIRGLTSGGLRFINMALSNARPAPEEELERPGLLQPILGAGSAAQIRISYVNFGYWISDIFTNVIYNAWAFSRLHLRVNEYPGGDSRVQGGVNTIGITVLLEPLGGPDIVELYVWGNGRALPLTAASDYASSPEAVFPNPIFTDQSLTVITNSADHLPFSILLSFGQGQRSATIGLVLTNDSEVEFNEDVFAALFALPNDRYPSQRTSFLVHPYADLCNITILYDDQPAGALDREWNPDSIEASDPPFNRVPGANNIVNAVAVQGDGKTLLAGDFTAVNAQPRNRIARLNFDGSVDTSFAPGTGADDFVSAVLPYPTNSLDAGKVLVVGGFTSFNGSQRKGIARLFGNGVLDTTFTPGNGANAPVRSVALQANGQILIAGDFTEFNNFSRNGFARLNPNGTLDATFDIGSGADATVWAVGLVPDGLGGEKVLVGGDFLSINNEFRAGIAQLNADGSVDLNFDPGGGANGTVFAIGVQADGRVLAAGAFTEFDARRRVRIVRLNSDGTLDASFDPRLGADDDIYSLIVQPDQKAVIGGTFASFNGTRRIGLARLRLDGTLDTSFMDTAYNQFAGFPRTFSFESPNYLNAIALQPDGNFIVGGSFSYVGGNNSFRAANQYGFSPFTRADKRFRGNIARILGGTTPGPGNAEFEGTDYFASENAGAASVRLIRTDGRLGTLIAEAGTVDRTASSGLDYTAADLRGVWREGAYGGTPWSVGYVGPFYLRVPILDDVFQEGNEILDMNFIRPQGNITLGGEYIPLGGALGLDSAALTISDNDFDPGEFRFLTPAFSTNENSIRASITVIRTNGTVGQVTVDYVTTTNVVAPRASAGLDYTPVTGTLTFASGVTRRTFSVNIANDTEVEFDENIGLILTNATGGATLPGGRPTSTDNAVLTVVDDDFPPGRINFSLDSYSYNENDGLAAITVTRTGGNSGAVSVQYQTLDDLATSPSDYLPANGLLSWNHGESLAKTFTVPLLRDGLVEGPETVRLRLFDGRTGGVPNPNMLGQHTNAVLFIEDGDAYGQVSFAQPYFQADEDGGTIAITILRQSGIAGSGSVDYATQADTAVPGAGGDYLNTSGTLTFQPGEFSKTFSVQLLDDTRQDGTKTVELVLRNPANVSLGAPSRVTLLIMDNESLNEPAGSLDTAFNPNISANGPVYTLALQLTNALPDGRIVVAGDFTEFNQFFRNRLVRLLTNGFLDPTFDPGLGANNTIRTLAVEPDGRWVIGGFFSQVLGTNRNAIARLNTDGTLDSSFNPGAGADNPIYSLVIQPDKKILAGGAFGSFNSISVPGIVRLNTNGTVDGTFQPGTGPDKTVFAVALQGDGKVLIGGEFNSVNGVPRRRIARLHANGALDSSFDANLSTNATIRAILVEPDGRIVIGGSFTNVGGANLNHLARLNTNGTVDATFLAGQAGANSAVYALARQIDGKLLVAGDFTRFNSVTRSRLTRLRPDGTTDPTINFGSGANGYIATLVIQPDRKIVVGGGFTAFDGLPRSGVARIHGGSMEGSGELEFVQPEFLVQEDGENALISVRRIGGTAGPVGVTYRTRNGTAMAGLHYLGVTNTMTFPEGETEQAFYVPILDNESPNGDRTLSLELIEGTYTGGAVAGPQPLATLSILDDEGEIGFSGANFAVTENVPNRFAALTVRRAGGTNNQVTVDFRTTNGTALAFADYIPTNGTLIFLPGELTKSFHIGITNDFLIEGNETVLVQLRNPGNNNTLTTSNATLLIVDDDFAPGAFQFSAVEYSAFENQTNLFVTVLRTNGSTGITSIKFRTADRTALGGSDFVQTNGVLAFADGETIRSFAIQILNDSFFEPVETLDLILFDPAGGATISSNNPATLTIFDDDVSQIVAAGSTLVAESFTPRNNAIDPGERVTLDLALRNVGTANTSNLLATLLLGNGVTQPSSPQSYGVLNAGGPSVSRPFSFTAAGNTGDLLIATLRLTDGPVTNGFVSFEYTLGGQASRTFANTNPIVINDNNIASPYPSTINVTNIGGVITNLTVTLSNLSHTYPDDLDVLLVGPSGEKALLMSDAGGPFSLSKVSPSFNERAANTLPDLGQILSIAYLPANYFGAGSADAFPPPAPPLPYTNTALRVFTGTKPIGTWSLYVVDDSVGDAGLIQNGWSLTLETAGSVLPSADLALAVRSSPQPVVVGQNLLCTINLTNYGPALASGVVVRDVLPAGVSFLSAHATTGSWSQNAGTVTFNLGTVPMNSGARLTITAITLQAGTVTNFISTAGNEPDVNAADNQTAMINTVVNMPAVSAGRQANNLLITWPTGANFILQQTPDLTQPAWTDVPTTPIPVGNQSMIFIPITGQKMFYRLRTP